MSAPPDAGLSDAEVMARLVRGVVARSDAVRTLGFRLLRVDQAAREAEGAFDGRREFCNPMGAIQGGFVTAMLDEVMSLAGVVASGLTHVVPTLEMKTSFLRPTPPGELFGVGRVLKWGRTVVYTEGRLFDAERRLLAQASATTLPTPLAGLGA